MRLHLPKALLAAVLAAGILAFSSSAQADTPTYSGDIYTWCKTGTTTADIAFGPWALSRPGADGSYTYGENITNWNSGDSTKIKIKDLFAPTADNQDDRNTLRFDSSKGSNRSIKFTFTPLNIAGIIVETGTTGYSIVSDGDQSNERSIYIGNNNATAAYSTIHEDFSIRNTASNNAKTGIFLRGTQTISIDSRKTLSLYAGNAGISISGSLTLTSGGTLALTGATTNTDTINAELTNLTVTGTLTNNGTLTVSGNLTSTDLLTNNGRLTISSKTINDETVGGSYTGGTITQGDDASLTLASGSVVNMGGMTATFGTGRDSSTSGLQSYTATYTIANGGTVTNNGAIFRVGGETFSGALTTEDGAHKYEITERRYNILEGEIKSISKVVSDVNQASTEDDPISSYLINVIGSTTEGTADGTLTGVSDDTLTHGISGNGIIQVDAGTKLSYSTIADKASDFTGTIVLAGSDLILDGNGVTFSRDLSVTDGSSLKLSGSTTLSGAITATANKVLSVSLADGATSGTLKLNGTTGKLSGAELQIENGVNVSVDGSNGTAYIKGAITVNAGGTLTLNGRDALGYDGKQTPSITLAGSATDGYATLDLGTTEQTMQTALNLNGYAKITGTGGSFNSWSNNANNFSKITVSGDHNEITCGVLVRQGLEVSVSENASLTISGAVAPKTGTGSGQSDAGFKKTGAGLLSITGNTSMNKQLQVQAGTMEISGTTNSLTGAVKVSDGAKLTLNGATSLNGTLSSVAVGDDAATVGTALIAITGGTTTISGGGGGNGAFVGTIRVDQGAELSITSGHVNVLTGDRGKVVVNGTLSIGNKESVNTAEAFYNVSGSGLITSAQTYTETTGEDGSTTSTGRLVTINLSTTDAFSGSVTATAGQVKLSGGRAENTLNTITANGGNVVIDSNMSAKTISTSGTSAVSVTSTATLLHDHMTYSGSTISGSNFSMLIGGTVSGGTVTQTGQEDTGYKELNAKLDGVHFVSNEGTEAHLNNSANSLTALTVNGTVKLTAKAAVTGSTNVGTNGKLYVASEESSLGAVSGAGTVSSSVNQSVTLARDAEGTASTFSGTLEATGKQMTVTSVGSESLNLAGIKANGGSINVMATSGDAIFGIVVSVSDLVIGAGSTVGVYKGSTVTETEEGEVYVYGSNDKKGSLTISGTGARLNADLTIVNTALTLDGVLTMGSSLTLSGGNTLDGSLFTNWNQQSALTLFEGVDRLYLNGATESAQVGVEYNASTVFDGMTGYSLLMTGGTNGKDYTVQLVQNAPTPEPTTATLSLLALMALAARRRRKA